MKINPYVLKLALSAGLAYAVGNAVHSQRISYVIYGAVLCLHPIAGDNLGYVLDKLRSAALGASVGMIVDVAFQSNPITMLAVGPVAMVMAGYFLGLPPRVLNFSGVVVIMSIASATYSLEPFSYIGLRFWNIFTGALVGITINLLLWPDRDLDKVGPAYAQTFATLRRLYDQIITDYKQGTLADNQALRRQFIASLRGQLAAIDKLMDNVKNEVNMPFVNTASYDRWSALQNQVSNLVLLMSDLHLALEGGDGDRLYQVLSAELRALVEATQETFDHLSQISTASSHRKLENPLVNFPILSQALSDRLTEIDNHRDLEINPAEVKRFAAFVYGLRAIASDLQNLAEGLKE